jgi:hypothetical protein
MKKYILLILLIFIQCSCFAINAKTGSQVLKTVISGIAASSSVAIGTYKLEKYLEAKSQIAKMPDLQGYNSSAAIYSIDFNLDPKKEAVYWADIIGKPDVYVVVEIEGYGELLVPSLKTGYSGGRVLKTFVGGNIKPGSKIRISLLDDDTLGDAVWNSILKTKVSWFIGAEQQNSEVISDITKGMRMGASANGTICLLDQKIEIDQPDLLATAEFAAPIDRSTWKQSGSILDSNNSKVGNISFSKIEEVKISKNRIFSSVFFYCFALVLGLIFFK